MSAPNPHQTSNSTDKCQAIMEFFKEAEANGKHVAFSHISYLFHRRVGKVTCEKEQKRPEWNRLSFQLLEWSWWNFKPVPTTIEDHIIYPHNPIERPSPDRLIVDREFKFHQYNPYNPLWKFQ